MQKQSPWSGAKEKGIDSLADWLIPTLGRPDDFTFTYDEDENLIEVGRGETCKRKIK